MNKKRIAAIVTGWGIPIGLLILFGWITSLMGSLMEYLLIIVLVFCFAYLFFAFTCKECRVLYVLLLTCGLTMAGGILAGIILTIMGLIL